MNDILYPLFLGLCTLAIIALVTVAICVMLDLRKTIRSARPFLEAAEKSLPETIEEIDLTLKSLKDVTDEAIAIMSDIRELSGAARAVGENVKRVSANVKYLSDDLENITSSVSGRISGIRAGVAAALSVIQKGLRK